MKSIRIDIEPTQQKEARLLVSAGFDDDNQRCSELRFENLTSVTQLAADFGQQKAHWLKPEQLDLPVSIEYIFTPVTHSVADEFWSRQSNRFTTASAALIDEISELIDTQLDIQDQITQLILLAKDRFSYGHADARFNDGSPTVPSVCGTTKGSCVDINTYLLACANALNIPCQYVAGYWFHPDKMHTLDMHCWLQFRAGEQVIPWDLAHHLKWGVSEIAPGLNPAGGRRVAMSYGRGLNFDSEYGELCISHFSEPVWIMPDGCTERPEMIIHIQESEEAIA
jgi:hypothetical protein